MPKEPASDSQDFVLAPLKIRMRASTDGKLAELTLQGRQIPGNSFDELHKQIMRQMDSSAGPGKDKPTRFELELDCDHNLTYDYVIEAIKATQANADAPNHEIIKLIEKIKFVPRRKQRPNGNEGTKPPAEKAPSSDDGAAVKQKDRRTTVEVQIKPDNKPPTAKAAQKDDDSQLDPGNFKVVMPPFESADEFRIVAAPVDGEEPKKSFRLDQDFASMYGDSIKDNTPFRPAEAGAWYHLCAVLEKNDSRKIRHASRGRVKFTDLFLGDGPRSHRCKLVTIHGVVRQVDRMKPPENEFGIKVYHRLTIQPETETRAAFLVYCLHLPDGFPTDKPVAEQVGISGFFFKKLAYPANDGQPRLAPLLLARDLAWGD